MLNIDIQRYKDSLEQKIDKVGGTNNFSGDLYRYCLELVKRADERAVDQKAYPGKVLYCCPACDSVLMCTAESQTNGFLGKYCPYCGQRIGGIYAHH